MADLPRLKNITVGRRLDAIFPGFKHLLGKTGQDTSDHLKRRVNGKQRLCNSLGWKRFAKAWLGPRCAYQQLALPSKAEIQKQVL